MIGALRAAIGGDLARWAEEAAHLMDRLPSRSSGRFAAARGQAQAGQRDGEQGQASRQRHCGNGAGDGLQAAVVCDLSGATTEIIIADHLGRRGESAVVATRATGNAPEITRLGIGVENGAVGEVEQDVGRRGADTGREGKRAAAPCAGGYYAAVDICFENGDRPVDEVAGRQGAEGSVGFKETGNSSCTDATVEVIDRCARPPFSNLPPPTRMCWQSPWKACRIAVNRRRTIAP
jgi:hypothetical protein